MKLLSSVGPNPKFVRMFIHEKGSEIATRSIDIVAGENLTPDFRVINPYAQLPVLLVDAGEPVCESIVICEYLDEVLPGPKLIGDTAEERARARMWYRRVDLDILQPMMAGYRSAEGLSFFEGRTPCFPESAIALKDSAAAGLRRLDMLLGARSPCREEGEIAIGDVAADQKGACPDAGEGVVIVAGVEIGHSLDLLRRFQSSDIFRHSAP